MTETKVLLIEVLDNFRTSNINTKNCILRWMGEYVGEDENYIFLKYKSVYFDGKEDSVKLEKVIKSAIVSTREFREVKENE